MLAAEPAACCASLRPATAPAGTALIATSPMPGDAASSVPAAEPDPVPGPVAGPVLMAALEGGEPRWPGAGDGCFRISTWGCVWLGSGEPGGGLAGVLLLAAGEPRLMSCWRLTMGTVPAGRAEACAMSEQRRA